MIRVLGEELLSHYLGILLIVPLMIMLLRTRLEQRALASLLMDGLLVMLPSMMILLVLSEQAAPQPQFARVLPLAPVLFRSEEHTSELQSLMGISYAVISLTKKM